jgi:hypothetical protein
MVYGKETFLRIYGKETIKPILSQNNQIQKILRNPKV